MVVEGFGKGAAVAVVVAVGTTIAAVVAVGTTVVAEVAAAVMMLVAKRMAEKIKDEGKSAGNGKKTRQ